MDIGHKLLSCANLFFDYDSASTMQPMLVWYYSMNRNRSMLKYFRFKRMSFILRGIFSCNGCLVAKVTRHLQSSYESSGHRPESLEKTWCRVCHVEIHPPWNEKRNLYVRQKTGTKKELWQTHCTFYHASNVRLPIFWNDWRIALWKKMAQIF